MKIGQFIFISLLMICLHPVSLLAQEKWDLSACIEQALKSHSDIKRKQVEVDRQLIQVQTDWKHRQSMNYYYINIHLIFMPIPVK
jgi:hypothetical protein